MPQMGYPREPKHDELESLVAKVLEHQHTSGSEASDDFMSDRDALFTRTGVYSPKEEKHHTIMLFLLEVIELLKNKTD